MKTVFEILEENNVDVNHIFDLKKFIEEDYFHFISVIDPQLLNQMTAEEICDTAAFYNNDSINPFKFLLEHNKVTIQGFDIMMYKELWMANRTDEKMDEFYKLLQDFILKNNIDVSKYFGESCVLSDSMQDLLMYYKDLDKVALLRTIKDLKTSLKDKPSLVTLLFNFKEDDTYTQRQDLINFIYENYNDVFDNFKNCYYKIKPSYYIKDCHNLLSNPFRIIVNDMLEKYGLLLYHFSNHEEIIEEVLSMLANEHGMVDQFKEVMDSIEDIFPKLHSKYKENFKHKFNAPSTYLPLDDLTIEKYHNYIESCSLIECRNVVTDMRYHYKINENEFNYKFNANMYYSDYTEEFLNFYINKSLEIYNSKNTAIMNDYRWSSFVQTMISSIIYLLKEKPCEWVVNAFVNCLDSDLYQNNFLDYIQNNGDIVLLNFVANNRKHLLSKFDPKKLILSTVVKVYNDDISGNKW